MDAFKAEMERAVAPCPAKRAKKCRWCFPGPSEDRHDMRRMARRRLKKKDYDDLYALWDKLLTS